MPRNEDRGRSSSIDRIPGQVCDRCRRRKIRCHGEENECAPCLQAHVPCITSTHLKRNRKRRSFYAGERSSQPRPRQPDSATPPNAQNARLSADPMAQASTAIASPSSASQQTSASRELTVPPLAHCSVSGPNPAPAPAPAPAPSSASAATTASIREPVVGHMGRLVTDDEQYAMFGGSTTGVHFISQTEQTLQVSQTHTDPFPSSAYGLYLHSLRGSSTLSSPRPAISSMVQQLPSDTLDIIGAAIDCWTPLYPVVHKPSVLETTEWLIRTCETAPEDNSLDAAVTLHQALILLALGTVGQPGGCGLQHFHFLCLSERFYAASTALMDHILSRPCLRSLQSLVLTQIYLQVSNRYSRASQLSGVAVRLAQALGLHRHSHRFKFDPLETELRRRAWWCQYSLDTFSSAYHGMPRLVRDRDVDTDLPTNVDHELLSRTHAQFSLPGETSQVDTAIRLFKLAHIVGNTLEALYTTTQRRGALAKIAHLQAELDAWKRDQDRDLDWDCKTTADTLDGAGAPLTLVDIFLRLSYNVATIHVHRPALAFTAAHPQYTESLRACGQSSANLIRIIADVFTSHAEHAFDCTRTGAGTWSRQLIAILLYPNGLHMLWQAGLTVIFARLKGCPVATDGDHEQDRDLVQSCISALRSLRSISEDVSGHVSQCAEVLDVLQGKVFSSGTREVPPPSESLDQLQWNIWDWPLESALDLINTLNTAPFGW